MRHVEDLVLDGNAVAGLLSEIFVPEMTTARFTCARCGAVRPLGAARLFDAAGLVLRCTDCSGVLLRVVTAPGRAFMDLTGIRRLEIALPTALDSSSA